MPSDQLANPHDPAQHSHMKKRSIVPLLLALIAAIPAAAGSPVWCQKLEWTAATTAAPTPADIATLRCWADGRDPAAGFALAMLTKVGRGVPADPMDARERLRQLSEGTRQDQARQRISGRNTAYDLTVNDWGTRTPDVAPYPPAMREYAKMLLLGEGGRRDIAAAKRWLALARTQDREAAILADSLAAAGY